MQDSEIDQRRSTELVDIMDMKLALQLYNADLVSYDGINNDSLQFSMIEKS